MSFPLALSETYRGPALADPGFAGIIGALLHSLAMRFPAGAMRTRGHVVAVGISTLYTMFGNDGKHVSHSTVCGVSNQALNRIRSNELARPPRYTLMSLPVRFIVCI